MGLELFTVGFGIHPRLAACVARGLQCAGGGYSGGDGGAVFGWGGVDQIGGADRFDIDAEVDAVEQRAGDARLIIGGAAWRAAARQRGVAEVAAAA